MKQSEHCIIQYKGFWSACQFLLFGDKKNSVTHYKNHCLVCMKPISELDKCPIAENKERVE